MTQDDIKVLAREISRDLKKTIREESQSAARNVEKTFIQNACMEVVPPVVKATLESLGIDCNDIQHTQKAMGHLYDSYDSDKDLKSHTKRRLVDIILPAGVAAFITGALIYAQTVFNAKPPTPGG